MAKNYILKIEELEFDSGEASGIISDNFEVTDLPTDLTGATLEIGGEKFLYAGVELPTYTFTRDGQLPESQPEEFVFMNFDDSTDNVNFDCLINKYPDSGAPYTLPVYLYTGEDDPVADLSGLSKNVTHTDHAYNDLESVLDKKGDPKTGYNTLEKIANASSEEGGGGGPGYTVTREVKEVIPEQTFIVDPKGVIELIANDGALDGFLTIVIDGVTYSDIPSYDPQESSCYWAIARSDEGNEMGLQCDYIDGTYSWLLFYPLTYDNMEHTISAVVTNKTIDVSTDFQLARGYYYDESLKEVTKITDEFKNTIITAMNVLSDGVVADGMTLCYISTTVRSIPAGQTVKISSIYKPDYEHRTPFAKFYTIPKYANVLSVEHVYHRSDGTDIYIHNYSDSDVAIEAYTYLHINYLYKPW